MEHLWEKKTKGSQEGRGGIAAAARQRVQAFLRSKNLAAGGIHSRQGSEIKRGSPQMEHLWGKKTRGIQEGRGGIAAAARQRVQAFLRSKNLAAGGIHSRRGSEIKEGSPQMEHLWGK